MAINKTINNLFNKYGVQFSLISNDSTTEFSCIFEPLLYKNKIYLSGVPTELGYDSLRKYLILAPADIEIEAVDGINIYLSYSGYRYKVDHCEKVYFKGKPLYYWSIIHREDSI